KDDVRLREVDIGEHGVVLRRKKLQVKEQTPVAIFRQTGEFVNTRDRYTRCEDGLNERVGQPLGQLVKRHEASGKAWARNLTVTPDIAEVDAPHAEAPWPDRTETLEHREQNLACRQSPF